MSLFKDEQGSYSTGRVLLWLNTFFFFFIVGAHWDKIPPDVLSALTTIELGLIGWNGGSRMAQYLFPQLGSVAGAINKGFTSRFSSKTTTVEENSSVDEGGTDESTLSTDVSESN